MLLKSSKMLFRKLLYKSLDNPIFSYSGSEHVYEHSPYHAIRCCPAYLFYSNKQPPVSFVFSQYPFPTDDPYHMHDDQSGYSAIEWKQQKFHTGIHAFLELQTHVHAQISDTSTCQPPCECEQEGTEQPAQI